ncbi:MAG: precorrin-8X methylmutase [Firmicutes bacterium]|nr:precorrin-8X methylmutase [Bacillota bacterium]
MNTKFNIEHFEFEFSPEEIEKKSFEIITRELGERKFSPDEEPVVKRVIHTTADMEYADNLYFSPDVISRAKEAIEAGAPIVTDTMMAFSGINKKSAAKFGCRLHCFMSDEDVAKEAKKRGLTRAALSMEKAAEQFEGAIFVVGNAPTALISLYSLVKEQKTKPAFIIAVPVGFVNVTEAKELIIASGIPCIAARGRKGGSNVAAAILNAILYSMDEKRGE